jgi:hypothetical protein
VCQLGTGKIYDTLNDVIELNHRMAKEFGRISNMVGKGGNIKQRAALPSATGDWQECIEVGQCARHRSGASDDRGSPGDRRGREG